VIMREVTAYPTLKVGDVAMQERHYIFSSIS